MRQRALARRLVGPALLLALAAGCQSLHRPRPVVVLARDAETKRPIAAAEVDVSYPFLPPAQAPTASVETAGADGVARVHATAVSDLGALVSANASGYLSESKGLNGPAVEALKPAGFFEAVEKRPVDVVLELYAAPGPTVELVLPAGYRGLVKVEARPGDISCPPGQRLFRYEVPPSGALQVVGPPLFRHLATPDFHLVYADGSALAWHGKDAPVGYWWIRAEGAAQVFLVGTQTEYDGMRQAGQTEGAANSRATGGKGGGGRRGGRHGNPQPSGDAGQGGTGQ
jgi:hypothetical protein